MIKRPALAFAAILAAAFTLPAAASQSLELTAADGVKVHAELWRAAAARPPIVLAFHQAGASHAEYAPIAPRLAEAGFSVLAIDQRSGGNEFGSANKTVAGLGRSTSYDKALPDLEAALAWAKANGKGAPIVVLGSSYSAALVFLLAAAHPGEVSGVVAYSPGEYLGGKGVVSAAARKVDVPVFIDQASSADEVAQSAAILRAVASESKQQFAAKAASPHGASTLRADRNARGAEAHWAALLKFLGRFKGA